MYEVLYIPASSLLMLNLINFFLMTIESRYCAVRRNCSKKYCVDVLGWIETKTSSTIDEDIFSFKNGVAFSGLKLARLSHSTCACKFFVLTASLSAGPHY
jgi:hypothetical protein